MKSLVHVKGYQSVDCISQVKDCLSGSLNADRRDTVLVLYTVVCLLYNKTVKCSIDWSRGSRDSKDNTLSPSVDKAKNMRVSVLLRLLPTFTLTYPKV